MICFSYNIPIFQQTTKLNWIDHKMAPTLRPRNAKLAPVNCHSFKIGKKVENLSAVKKKTIDKKKKKLVKISDDVLLDILRLFTRRELCSFKLVNRRMKRVVELGDQKKQLLQRFVIPIIHFSSSISLRKRKSAIIRANTWMARNGDEKVSDEDKQQLQNVLAKNLKLLLTEGEVAKEFCITILLTDDDETSTYVVKLQNHPKTVKGLHRIRFWLRELSRVHFTDATTCCYPSLNPALVEALFPKEDIFLSLGDFKIRMLPNFMLPSIASLFRIGVLRCATHRFSDCVKTLFNELLLKSKHGVHTLDCLYYLTVSMADIIKLLDGLEYAQLKRLPSEMQFRNVVFGSLKNLKHIETTGETEKYELLVRNSGCMKIFLVRTRGMQQRLTVHLIDQ